MTSPPDPAAIVAKLTAAQRGERAAIVAWLRKEATEWRVIGNNAMASMSFTRAANAIERGDHLKQER